MNVCDAHHSIIRAYDWNADSRDPARSNIACTRPRTYAVIDTLAAIGSSHSAYGTMPPTCRPSSTGAATLVTSAQP